MRKAKIINEKYTCLLFGEGRRDKNFIYALTELPKFRFHTKNWFFTYGNGHGSSATDILKLCEEEKTGEENITLCFIDLDDLKNDYPGNWSKKKRDLEADALSEKIKIIWQIDSAEDEYKKVLGEGYKSKSKNKINKEAKENINKFINSNLWQRILKPIIDFEKKDKK